MIYQITHLSFGSENVAPAPRDTLPGRYLQKPLLASFSGLSLCFLGTECEKVI